MESIEEKRKKLTNGEELLNRIRGFQSREVKEQESRKARLADQKNEYSDMVVEDPKKAEKLAQKIETLEIDIRRSDSTQDAYHTGIEKLERKIKALKLEISALENRSFMNRIKTLMEEFKSLQVKEVEVLRELGILRDAVDRNLPVFSRRSYLGMVRVQVLDEKLKELYDPCFPGEKIKRSENTPVYTSLKVENALIEAGKGRVKICDDISTIPFEVVQVKPPLPEEAENVENIGILVSFPLNGYEAGETLDCFRVVEKVTEEEREKIFKSIQAQD
ncbi:MAG: hypothetical protein NT096_01660 [Proteobacteria bacterium]|nr:hypothetical protein [Pseudomonadota bacterium]